jgi:hypothetical protein
MNELSFQVAIVMERVPTANRWQSHRWQVVEMREDDGTLDAPVVLVDDATRFQKLYPGFVLTVFRDEAEGYFLNVSSPEPSVFAVWRFNEDESEAFPHAATLSYNEAARWMDSQEKVERLPMPREIFAALAAWVDANYKPPEKKQRIRPKSFESKEGRYKSGM